MEATGETAKTSELPNLPWVEKYRPSRLEELISHDDIITTINRFLSQDRLPHLLLYGPPGTGKTSTVLAVAKQIYKPGELTSHVLELNASDDRGIDTVRNKIMNFAGTKPAGNYSFKMIILDEADAMTKDAQNSLRRIIERFTETTRFCIICNYLSKIIPAIQSRCTRFRFSPLKKDQILPRLHEVCRRESLSLNQDGEKALLTLAEGDMRRVLNILQTCSMASDGEITEESVYTCVGHPLPSHIEQVADRLFNHDFVKAYREIFALLQDRGYALQDILSDLHLFVHRINMPSRLRINIIDKMAEIEERLLVGSSDKIQLSALVAAFQEAKE